MIYKESKVLKDTLLVTPYNGDSLDYIQDLLYYIEVARYKKMRRLEFFESKIAILEDLDETPRDYKESTNILTEEINGELIELIYINSSKVYRTRKKTLINNVIQEKGYINILKNSYNSSLYPPSNTYIDNHFITILSFSKEFVNDEGMLVTNQGSYYLNEGIIMKG